MKNQGVKETISFEIFHRSIKNKKDGKKIKKIFLFGIGEENIKQ